MEKKIFFWVHLWVNFGGNRIARRFEEKKKNKEEEREDNKRLVRKRDAAMWGRADRWKDIQRDGGGGQRDKDS